jgi:hypothetical protein
MRESAEQHEQFVRIGARDLVGLDQPTLDLMQVGVVAA